MKTLIKVDLNSQPEEQDILHNRWHPDIPMVAMVEPGDEFRVECIDWTGGQINNDDDATDIKVVDITNVANICISNGTNISGLIFGNLGGL